VGGFLRREFGGDGAVIAPARVAGTGGCPNYSLRLLALSSLLGHWREMPRKPGSVRKKQSQWCDDLRTPISWAGPLSLGAPPPELATCAPHVQAWARGVIQYNVERWRASAARAASERERKLVLVAAHYGLPAIADGDKELVVSLVSEFLPGFQIRSDQTSPARWDDEAHSGLVADIEVEKRAHPTMGDAAACRAIKARYPARYGRDVAKSLNNRLVEARANVACFLGVLRVPDSLEMDVVISLFACDPAAVAEADARLAEAARAELGPSRS
jgi:hypothetical protein